MRLCDAWDAHAWVQERKKRFAYFRELRRKVFAATIEASMNGYYMLGCDRIELQSASDITSGTKMYCEELVPQPMQSYADVKAEVVNGDCLAVAKTLVDAKIGKVAVLNMAIRTSPGGGVISGAGAQEEYLFRCSDYYKSLYQFVDYGAQYNVERNEEYSYPMDRDFGGCYSPNVTIFRGVEEDGYPFLAKTWQVNFIAVAALNRPETVCLPNGSMRLVDYLVPTAKNKIRTIFNIAIDNGVQVLVLGAFGCGAYQNPPVHIAQLFKEILAEPEYRNAFKKVVFAIKQDHNSVSVNNKTLVEVLSEVFGSEAAKVVRKLHVGDVVRHFKRETEASSSTDYLYKIVAFAEHTETGESLVIYQSLYPPFNIWARPYDMFMSEVDKEKYPEIKQKYRFEALSEL